MIPGTVAYQAPLSVEFSRQEYWSGLPFPSPGDISEPGINPGSPALQAGSLPSEPPGILTRADGSCQQRPEIQYRKPVERLCLPVIAKQLVLI